MPRHEEATSLPPLSPEQEAQTAREMGVLREDEIRYERIIEEQCYSLSPQELTNRLVAYEKMLSRAITAIQTLQKDRGVAA